MFGMQLSVRYWYHSSALFNTILSLNIFLILTLVLLNCFKLFFIYLKLELHNIGIQIKWKELNKTFMMISNISAL